MSEIFLDSLKREVGRFALCWKLTRGDGVVLGFTSHDRDLVLGGLTFLARPGMTPSAVSGAAGFAPGSMEVSGTLDAKQISAFDLDVGRWNGARVELFACDWSNVDSGTLCLIRGRIGDTSRPIGQSSGEFSVELVSDIVPMLAQGAPLCSPLCRAELGDRRCTVDLATRFRDTAVAPVAVDALQLVEALDRPGDYSDGRIRFLEGVFAGIDRRIARIDGDLVLLEEPLVPLVGGSIVARLYEGCDKRFATCAGRFENASAFDGEPHVPGTDALIRYGEA